MMNNIFNGPVLIIYSCSKNDKKSQLLYKLLSSITDSNIKIYILNGNIDLIEDYKIIHEKIYLKCKSQSTKPSLKEFYLSVTVNFKNYICIFR